jgi:peptidyl-prolyl cis-trans isomerase B (cyclophilin B)
MRKFFVSLVMLVLLAVPSLAEAQDEIIYVRLATTKGDIDIALNKTKAPISVENFLTYAKEGYFNGMVFHRVVPGVLIQSGGYNKYLFERAKHDAIQNEADNGLKNMRGTIAMARHDDPHSARSQFFINLIHNEQLDFRDKELVANWGYAVFGEVVGGMDVADAIGSVAITEKDQFEEFPEEMILLNAVSIIEKDEIPANSDETAKADQGNKNDEW